MLIFKFVLDIEILDIINIFVTVNLITFVKRDKHGNVDAFSLQYSIYVICRLWNNNIYHFGVFMDSSVYG